MLKCKECGAARDAVAAFLAQEDIADFERAHRDYDREFAEDVPQYKADCARIAAAFDALRAAIDK